MSVQPPTRNATIFALGCALLLIAVIVHAAWMCEDAFITLRTVDNWVNGFGLRWNVAERVQSYTHPLWLLCLTPVYWLTRSPTLGLIVPSLIASSAFCLRFVRCASDRWLAGALLLVLAASKGFVEFSSPGLENPLVHLLLAIYVVVTTRTLNERGRLWPVALLSALLFVTRADLLWLIAPSLLVAAWRTRRELLSPSPWLAITPFVAWEAFSLVYYGFPFSNTAYAKLATGMPMEDSIGVGLLCHWAWLRYDPITVLVIAAGVVSGVASRRRAPLLFALGILSWQLYLVRVGGDYMISRLLTPALVIAVLVLLDTLPVRARRWSPAAGALLLLASLASPRSPLYGRPRLVDKKGWLPERVTDERALEYKHLGLFRQGPGPTEHEWVVSARAALASGQTVLPLSSVGVAGYFVGPKCHIVDQFGLCDPLLARMPSEHSRHPGHFYRPLPDGYLETLSSGQNQFADAILGERYAELQLITRGRLFSAKRWRLIWRWNAHPPELGQPHAG